MNGTRPRRYPRGVRRDHRSQPPDPHPPGRRSYQPKTVGPAVVGMIRIRQRPCLIMAAR
jgi:hypothetical protein